MGVRLLGRVERLLLLTEMHAELTDKKVTKAVQAVEEVKVGSGLNPRPIHRPPPGLPPDPR